MLFRGMLSFEELQVLRSSAHARFGQEARITAGYELGQILRDYADQLKRIQTLIQDNPALSSISGRQETSLRISQQTYAALEAWSAQTGLSKISLVRALLALRKEVLSQHNNCTSLRLLSWNVNRFQPIPEAGITQEEFFSRIIQKIKAFLQEGPQSLAVLQEVPYNLGTPSWKPDPWFARFQEAFPDSEYRLLSHKSTKFQLLTTVMICRRESGFSLDDSIASTNRIVYCRHDHVSIVGVHMHTNFRAEKDSFLRQEAWDSLIRHVRESTRRGKKVILVGDFNAHFGCQDQTEQKFLELSREAHDLIPDDVPTFLGQTAIDHVFVNYNTNHSYRYTLQQEFLSDHKFIKIEFDTP